MYRLRLFAVRHAAGFERLYGMLERMMVRLDPIFARLGYDRVERPVALVERAAKGLLFDCRMCGQCVLSSTGMSCPMNCPKELRNGPCGGVRPGGFCEVRPDMRIVMLTGYGNIATAVAAVKVGAIDYLAKPADADDIDRALNVSGTELPPPPDNPMSADRVRWEHIQRVFEQCERNVSETARRLNMHRRTLQRILSKRSPHE